MLSVLGIVPCTPMLPARCGFFHGGCKNLVKNLVMYLLITVGWGFPLSSRFGMGWDTDPLLLSSGAVQGVWLGCGVCFASGLGEALQHS